MDFAPGQRLVIFGAGYVGAALARAGIARGLHVTALTRNPATAADLVAAGVETVVADLAGEAWHSRIAPDADYVVNCVGSGGGGVEGYRHSYLGGMRSLLAWAGAGRIGPLVYTSSTSVYPQDGGVRLDDDAAVGGGATADVLLEAEELLRAWGRVGGPPLPSIGESRGGVLPPSFHHRRAFILRLAGIYGPGRHYLLDDLRAGARELAGSGGHHLNLIYRDDVVGAICAALTAPAAVAGGTFNVADDGAATREEVAAWLAARLGRPEPRFTGAPAPGRSRITPDRVIGSAGIRRTLGWAPAFPTFREGYEKILSR